MGIPVFNSIENNLIDEDMLCLIESIVAKANQGRAEKKTLTHIIINSINDENDDKKSASLIKGLVQELSAIHKRTIVQMIVIDAHQSLSAEDSRRINNFMILDDLDSTVRDSILFNNLGVTSMFQSVSIKDDKLRKKAVISLQDQTGYSQMDVARAALLNAASSNEVFSGAYSPAIHFLCQMTRNMHIAGQSSEDLDKSLAIFEGIAQDCFMDINPGIQSSIIQQLARDMRSDGGGLQTDYMVRRALIKLASNWVGDFAGSKIVTGKFNDEVALKCLFVISCLIREAEPCYEKTMELSETILKTIILPFPDDFKMIYGSSVPSIRDLNDVNEFFYSCHLVNGEPTESRSAAADFRSDNMAWSYLKKDLSTYAEQIVTNKVKDLLRHDAYSFNDILDIGVFSGSPEMFLPLLVERGVIFPEGFVKYAIDKSIEYSSYDNEALDSHKRLIEDKDKIQTLFRISKSINLKNYGDSAEKYNLEVLKAIVRVKDKYPVNIRFLLSSSSERQRFISDNSIYKMKSIGAIVRAGDFSPHDFKLHLKEMSAESRKTIVSMEMGL